MKDLIHMGMETHLLLDSKIFHTRTIKVGEELFQSTKKFQTLEVETHTKLELQLIHQTIHGDQRLLNLDKDLNLLEMEIPS
jgi:hypothetical protein